MRHALRRHDRMRARQAAIDRECLAVDVRSIVGREEQRHLRDLDRRAGAAQRIELADLVIGAARARLFEDRAASCRSRSGPGRWR